MKKLVLAFIILTVVVAAAILLFNRPEQAPKGATLVPDSTLLFVEIPNFAESRNKLSTTPLARLMDEPEMREFLEKPLGSLRQAIFGDGKDAESSQALQEQLLDLPQGELFVAITHLTTAPSVQVSTVVGIDVKSHKLETQAKLKFYEHQLQKYNPQITIEPKTYLGNDYKVYHLSAKSQIDEAFLGSMLILAQDEDTLREMISRYKGETSPDLVSLAASPRYANVLRQMPEGRDGHVFLNVDQLVSQLGIGMLLLAAGPSGAALAGITEMQAAATSVTLSDTGVTDVGLFTYKKNRPVEGPLSLHTLAAAPADSTLYHAGTTDLAGGYTKLMNLLASSDNKTAMQIGSTLDKFLADANVRLADDFLAHLGPEVAYVGNWRQGSRTPDFALVVEVKNRPAIAETFNKIVTAVSQAVRTNETATTDDLTDQGETFHIIHTANSSITPTYVLTDKFFILALTSDYAKEIVAQAKTGKASLADTAEYKRNIQLLPAIGSEVTYCDLRKLVGGIYSLARTTGTNTDANAIFEAKKLPQTETIARYLGTFVSTTLDTEKTSSTTTHSAIGKPMTAVVALGGGLIAAQPLLEQIPWNSIPGLPTMSLGTRAPPPPAGNQKAASRTP